MQVGGYFAMNAAMPSMLSWVLGGNGTVAKNQERAICCHIDDKPNAFPTEVIAAPARMTILLDDECLGCALSLYQGSMACPC